MVLNKRDKTGVLAFDPVGAGIERKLILAVRVRNRAFYELLIFKGFNGRTKYEAFVFRNYGTAQDILGESGLNAQAKKGNKGPAGSLNKWFHVLCKSFGQAKAIQSCAASAAAQGMNSVHLHQGEKTGVEK